MQAFSFEHGGVGAPDQVVGAIPAAAVPGAIGAGAGCMPGEADRASRNAYSFV